MYLHSKQVLTAGLSIEKAKKAIVMIHGRGGSAQDIITLKEHLNLNEMAIFAPQASQRSWYPYSFMAPEAQNQPALDSALDVIDDLVKDIEKAGIPADSIYLLGFSQGACLTLEYLARNAQQYGGAVAFTGGLIGETLITERYKGDFESTPILISTGNPDPHVPLERVQESISILKNLNSNIHSQVFNGKQHSISLEEINLANQYIFKK
ncbi:alpha/beta hydrolase [Arcicella rosea]|uniref:Phospholipase/carboxylesterase n=1 Tax=Arcicella rosea TaxID=502909 RepID=A0A841EHX1_9BACT|nr:dienelactone hydrolase family protein [Arcicella rosea]MBB6002765.1 phospholipase/carboxylesterase [Arcicella rosea]